MSFSESRDRLRAASFAVTLLTALSLTSCAQPAGSASSTTGAELSEILAGPAGIVPVPVTAPEGFVVTEVEATAARSLKLIGASGDTLEVRTPDFYTSPEAFTFACDEASDASYCAVHDTNQPPLSKVVVITTGSSEMASSVMTAIASEVWTYSRHATWIS